MWSRISLTGGVRKAVSKADAALAGKLNSCTKADAISKISGLYLSQRRKNRDIVHSIFEAKSNYIK